MRAFTVSCALLLLGGCAKPESKTAAVDSITAAPMGAGAAPMPISFAAVAGKWSMRTMSATSDSVLLTYELTATADSTGWVLALPNRAPLPARVVAAGDSIVADVGPYESVLRKGVQVTTHTVFRLEGPDLVGAGIAHYLGTGADTTLNLRMRGTRVP